MDWGKFSIGTLIGGIVYFFLGWLIMGILLADATAIPADIAAVVQIPEADFKISYMVIGCFVRGALLTLILHKWASVSTFMGGLKTAAAVGLLISLSENLMVNSMFKLYSLDQIGLNVIGDTICMGIAGGVIGWFLGRGK